MNNDQAAILKAIAEALGTKWLTIDGAAKHAELSQDAIRAAIRNGDLPSYSPTPGGRNVRLKASEVDEWITSKPYVPRSA